MHKAALPGSSRRSTAPPLAATRLLPHRLHGGWIIPGLLACRWRKGWRELQHPTPAIQHDEPWRADNEWDRGNCARRIRLDGGNGCLWSSAKLGGSGRKSGDASSVRPGWQREPCATINTDLHDRRSGGVFLWAPVEPAYDANANRDLAANPSWESSGPTTR
jgi:hypothetical protein